MQNKLEGIGWFTYETLKRITTAHPDVEFYFLFDRKYDPAFLFGPNVKAIVLHPQARHPFLFVLWFEWAVYKALKKIQPDLFLSPDGYLSLKTKVKSLAIIHDLNFEHFPKDLPWLVRHYYRFFFPRFAHKASRVVTVSQFSKKDIIQQYSIDADKVDVVYNGVNERFIPLSTNNILHTRNRFTNGKPYFLFVGSLHPRKNLIRLFKAYDRFRERSQEDVKLLIVGEKKWWTPEMEQAFASMKHRSEVFFSGRLNHSDLHFVTASALATTYVSYFEGFGIPIIESFRCGVPVITSNVTSMPEVAGNAAILVDPFDIESICKALVSLAGSEELRNDLISKGLQRSKEFSWDHSADQLWRSIQRTLTQF